MQDGEMRSELFVASYKDSSHARCTSRRADVPSPPLCYSFGVRSTGYRMTKCVPNVGRVAVTRSMGDYVVPGAVK
jgi:hypothetical protein